MKLNIYEQVICPSEYRHVHAFAFKTELTYFSKISLEK